MDRERGASLVEFALVLPLLLMIILGLVSAGAAYNLRITLTHSAREAARYAAVLPTDVGASIWFSNVEARLLDDAAGALDSGQPGAEYCIAYVNKSESDPGTLHIDETTSTPTTGPCFSDGRDVAGVDEWRVQVQVGRDADFNVLLFSKTIHLTTNAVSRYEVMVSG